MPPPQQRLIFSGRQMCVYGKAHRSIIPIDSKKKKHFLCTYRADDKLAKDFGIQPGAVLHLVLALRGGSGGGCVQS